MLKCSGRVKNVIDSTIGKENQKAPSLYQAVLVYICGFWFSSFHLFPGRIITIGSFIWGFKRWKCLCSWIMPVKYMALSCICGDPRSQKALDDSYTLHLRLFNPVIYHWKIDCVIIFIIRFANMNCQYKQIYYLQSNKTKKVFWLQSKFSCKKK